MADALSISSVHASRTLQEIRAAELINLKGSIFKALDWERLKEAGKFNPTYLHLEDTREV